MMSIEVYAAECQHTLGGVGTVDGGNAVANLQVGDRKFA